MNKLLEVYFKQSLRPLIGRRPPISVAARTEQAFYNPFYLALLAFALSRVLIIAGFPMFVSDVEGLYFPTAVEWLLHGKAPYSELHFPYPPLALAIVGLPGLFSRQLEDYRFLFQICMLTVDCFGLWLLVRFLRSGFGLGNLKLSIAVWIYSILGLLCGSLLYDRLDLTLAVAFLAAVVTFKPNKGYGWGIYLALAIGFLIKIVPLIWAPFAAIADSIASQRKRFEWRIFARSLIFGIAAPLLVLKVLDITFAGFVFKSLRDHLDRGIQIESLWASPLLVLKLIDPSISLSIEFNFGSHHLAGEAVFPMYLVLSKWMGPVSIIVLLVIFTWVGLKRSGLSMRGCLDWVITVLLVWLVTARVLSPQFFIWLIPLLSASLAVTPSVTAMILSILLFLLNFAVFPLGFAGIVAFDPLWVSALCARNIVLISLAALMLFRCTYRAKNNEMA
ncbi:MAG: hypothetical protein ABIQ95_06705 [Bdellovibrionia bacterium]